MTDDTKRETLEELANAIHEACLMEAGRVCEQTCDMPDGLPTHTCEELHLRVNALLAAAKRIEVLALQWKHWAETRAERIAALESERDKLYRKFQDADERLHNVMENHAADYAHLKQTEAEVARLRREAHSCGCACLYFTNGEIDVDPDCAKLREGKL